MAVKGNSGVDKRPTSVCRMLYARNMIENSCAIYAIFPYHCQKVWSPCESDYCTEVITAFTSPWQSQVKLYSLINMYTNKMQSEYVTSRRSGEMRAEKPRHYRKPKSRGTGDGLRRADITANRGPARRAVREEACLPAERPCAPDAFDINIWCNIHTIRYRYRGMVMRNDD